MRRTIAIVSAVVVLAGAVTAGLYWRWVNSPVYALHQMVSALKVRNYNEFFKYLVLNEIITGVLEAGSKELLPKEGAKEDQWSKFGRALGEKFAGQFIPKLFGSLDKQIRGLIEQYLRQLTDEQIRELAEALTLADVQTQGEVSRVTLKFKKTGDRLGVTMRRNPQDKVWRVVAVSYDDIKKLVLREF